jgi:hypothetical protein
VHVGGGKAEMAFFSFYYKGQVEGFLVHIFLLYTPQ